MRIETVDIVRDLVENWKIKLKISLVEVIDAESFKVFVCDTYYIQSGNKLTINNENYEVLAIELGEWVILKGTLLTKGTYLLDSPSFFHGTLLETIKQITGTPDMADKTPMVYLRRPYRDQFGGIEDTVERISQVTIYFLTEDNWEEFDIDSRDVFCVKPMRSLCYSFIEMLRANSQLIFTDEGFTVEDKMKFGVYTDKGVVYSHWKEPLSGVQLDIDLPIKFNYVCKC